MIVFRTSHADPRMAHFNKFDYLLEFDRKRRLSIVLQRYSVFVDSLYYCKYLPITKIF